MRLMSSRPECIDPIKQNFESIVDFIPRPGRQEPLNPWIEFGAEIEDRPENLHADLPWGEGPFGLCALSDFPSLLMAHRPLGFLQAVVGVVDQTLSHLRRGGSNYFECLGTYFASAGWQLSFC